MWAVWVGWVRCLGFGAQLLSWCYWFATYCVEDCGSPVLCCFLDYCTSTFLIDCLTYASTSRIGNLVCSASVEVISNYSVKGCPCVPSVGSWLVGCANLVVTV